MLSNSRGYGCTVECVNLYLILCLLLLWLSVSPGLFVLLHNKPAVSCQRLGVGESVDCTHQGRRSYLAFSREASCHLPGCSFPPSASGDNVQGFRERFKLCSCCLSLQPALWLGFLSSTNFYVHFPFTANHYYLRVLLSSLAFFF